MHTRIEGTRTRGMSTDDRVIRAPLKGAFDGPATAPDYSTQVAVITGAGSGIGRALAQLCARKGYSLALADINEKGLKETEALLQFGGGAPSSSSSSSSSAPSRVLLYPLDVSQRSSVESFASAVVGHFGRTPDLVVNNAGVAVSQTTINLEYRDFEWIMGINFWGVVYGTKAFLPGMVAARRGTIVNISSVFGLIGVPSQSSYNASKFAVRGFTEALQHELEEMNVGVRAVVVCPGGIKTNIARSSRFYCDADGNATLEAAGARFDELAKTTPEQAAEAIWTGAVVEQQRRVLIGTDAKVISALVRLLPTAYWKVFKWLEGGKTNKASAPAAAATTQPQGKKQQ